MIMLCSCVSGIDDPTNEQIEINFIINGRKETIHLEQKRSIDVLDVPEEGHENAIGIYTDEAFDVEYDGSIIDEDTTFYVKCNTIGGDYRGMTRIDNMGYHVSKLNQKQKEHMLMLMPPRIYMICTMLKPLKFTPKIVKETC
jgi:hypothetical protein